MQSILFKFGSQTCKKLIFLDKNIFHWRVKTGLKDNFIIYYFLRQPRIVKIVNCFGPLGLSTCHNWELFIAHPHRPLCFKKIRTTTTTAFLISNTVIPNPYSLAQNSILYLSHPYLKFQVCLTDLSQSDNQIIYSLQKDNGICQLLDRCWTGI